MLQKYLKNSSNRFIFASATAVFILFSTIVFIYCLYSGKNVCHSVQEIISNVRGFAEFVGAYVLGAKAIFHSKDVLNNYMQRGKDVSSNT